MVLMSLFLIENEKEIDNIGYVKIMEMLYMTLQTATSPIFQVVSRYVRISNDKLYYSIKFIPILCCECLNEKT